MEICRINVNCLLIVALGWAHKLKYVDATSRCIIVSIGEIIPLQQSKILPQNCICVRDDNSPFAHVIMLQCPITADVFRSWHVIINIVKNFPSPCLQWPPLLCFSINMVNSPVSRSSNTFKSRWMLSNASMPHNFWYVNIMSCLHQFKRVFAISRAALPSITGFFHLQG